ncbi:hypothetical protein IV203_006087 [Nitzschia inconspicua]|uniref:Uncharacterized protein n=1 Tax=Nitzschia inconspicua TaxID=303405 RepID=A0A9K3KNI4_9STRA|nr:hypothetical protein IV203_006087 [Nitzschia inconspicua]
MYIIAIFALENQLHDIQDVYNKDEGLLPRDSIAAARGNLFWDGSTTEKLLGGNTTTGKTHGQSPRQGFQPRPGESLGGGPSMYFDKTYSKKDQTVVSRLLATKAQEERRSFLSAKTEELKHK